MESVPGKAEAQHARGMGTVLVYAAPPCACQVFQAAHGAGRLPLKPVASVWDQIKYCILETRMMRFFFFFPQKNPRTIGLGVKSKFRDL